MVSPCQVNSMREKEILHTACEWTMWRRKSLKVAERRQDRAVGKQETNVVLSYVEFRFNTAPPIPTYINAGTHMYYKETEGLGRGRESWEKMIYEDSEGVCVKARK